MKQEFTDDQIIEAKNVAAYNTSREWISRFNVVDIRAILEALPEPKQDEWEAYDVMAVRKGDRVRWTVPGSEDNESYEIVVAAVTNDWGVILDSESSSYYFPYGAVVDRIPSPVTYPDPDYHPVVISNVGDAWLWDAYEEHYIEICGGGHRGPGDFGAGWVPGKVVADDEM